MDLRRYGVILVAAAVLAGCKLERYPREPAAPPVAPPLDGLRTVVYHVADLGAARDWYAALLGQRPYFDESFYVGFEVAGFELGLDPDTTGASPGPGGTVAYWAVSNADSVLARAIELGAIVHEPVQDVGGGVRIGAVRDPFGNVLGVVEAPGTGTVR